MYRNIFAGDRYGFKVMGGLAAGVLSVAFSGVSYGHDDVPAEEGHPATHTRRESTHRHVGAERDGHKDTKGLGIDGKSGIDLLDSSVASGQGFVDEISDTWEGVEDHGIEVSGSVILDHSRNLDGGLSTSGSTTGHLLDIGITAYLETLAGIEGGVAYINFQNQTGEFGSVDAGDFQGVSNIEADGRTQISELWYEQTLYNGAWRVVVGKRDVNSEFAYVDHGGLFLNGSFGISPNILELPTYPDPAMGVIVFGYFGDHAEDDVQRYAGVGVFDGSSREGVRTGSRGPSTFLSDPADLFIIGEGGITWGNVDPSLLPGRLAMGGWGHTGTFGRFHGGVEEGTEGFYLVFDQLISVENPEDLEDEQGVGFFMQFGLADDDVAEVEYHISGGFTVTGAVEGRDQDTAGIGVTAAVFSEQARFAADEEITIEVFYEARLAPFVSVQPDLQYIVNPGGEKLDDALVGTLRTVFEF